MRSNYGAGLWKAIRNLWELVSCRISFIVGNGRRIKFWKDKWCGDELVCVLFPLLFALAILEVGSVKPFPSSVVWNVWVLPKVSLFTWEASNEGNFDFRPTTKEGLVFSQDAYEESIDHILLHCGKTRVLWALLFFVFGVYWMIHSN